MPRRSDAVPCRHACRRRRKQRLIHQDRGFRLSQYYTVANPRGIAQAITEPCPFTISNSQPEIYSGSDAYCITFAFTITVAWPNSIANSYASSFAGTESSAPGRHAYADAWAHHRAGRSLGQ